MFTTALILTLFVQDGTTSSRAPDPWLDSLDPDQVIVVGDLTPKWGDLFSTPDPQDDSAAGGAATTGGASGGGAGAGSAVPGFGGPGSAPTQLSEREPNSSWGQRQWVSSRATVSGAIEPKGDTDWFGVEVPRRGVLEVRVSGVAASIDPHLLLRNGDGHAVGGWRKLSLRSGASDVELLDLSAAGRYSVEVADGKNDAAGAYTLHLHYVPGDVHEPNGRYADVTPVPSRGTVEGTIWPLADHDLLRFDVDRRGSLELVVEHVPDGFEPALLMRNGDRHAVGGWVTPAVRNGRTEAHWWDLREAGTYYLDVAESKDDARVKEAYVLRLEAHLGDAHEPNETFGKATPITATAATSLSVLPLGDVDVFRFDVERRGILEVTFEGVPGDIDPAILPRNGDGHAIGGWRSPALRGGATETVVIDLSEAGPYSLEVADSKHDARDPRLFTMRTRAVLGDAHEPNESLGAARRLSLGQTARANLLPLGDTDVFFVETSGPTTLEIQLARVPDAMTPALLVRNREGHAIGGWRKPSIRDGRTEAVTIDVKDPGRYYVEVTEDGRDVRVADSYELVVRTR